VRERESARERMGERHNASVVYTSIVHHYVIYIIYVIYVIYTDVRQH